MAFDSTVTRDKRVLALVREYYESGRHDRCLKWVWRNHVLPAEGLSYNAFQGIIHRNGFYVRRRCLSAEQLAEAQRRQMTLPIWQEEKETIQ